MFMVTIVCAVATPALSIITIWKAKLNGSRQVVASWVSLWCDRHRLGSDGILAGCVELGAPDVAYCGVEHGLLRRRGVVRLPHAAAAGSVKVTSRVSGTVTKALVRRARARGWKVSHCPLHSGDLSLRRDRLSTMSVQLLRRTGPSFYWRRL